MDADWYEDPLDRYDGRFFDGENWTAEVSDDGVLKIDEDFPPAGDEFTDEFTDEFGDADREAPAVAPVTGPSTTRAITASESPVRVVAVLDESVVARRATSVTTAPTEPAEPAGRSSRLWLLAGLLAFALALVAVFYFTRSDAPELDQDQADRVEDLEAGSGVDGVALEDLDVDALEVDAPEGISDPQDRFDPSEMIQIGSLSVVNGSSVLADLVAWHERFADERDVVLGDNHGCWFGQLAGAAVQVAHCGPVSGSADTEYFFDLVPVDFVDVEEGQLAQPIVDAVTPNTVIPNAVTLIGSADGPAPPEGLTETRGERGGG